jgi:hypothetical protein
MRFDLMDFVSPQQENNEDQVVPCMFNHQDERVLLRDIVPYSQDIGNVERATL